MLQYFPFHARLLISQKEKVVKVSQHLPLIVSQLKHPKSLLHHDVKRYVLYCDGSYTNTNDSNEMTDMHNVNLLSIFHFAINNIIMDRIYSCAKLAPALNTDKSYKAIKKIPIYMCLQMRLIFAL